MYNSYDDKFEYVKIDYLDNIDLTEWKWCYSAKQFQKELQKHFLGKKIETILVDIQGYIYNLKYHNKTFIDLDCQNGKCYIVIGDDMLELIISVIGLIRYRIIPLSFIKIARDFAIPARDWGILENCYFDIDRQDNTIKIKNTTIKNIIVNGTNEWGFSQPTYDESLAKFAASKNDLPGEVIICTDSFNIRIVGSENEYFVIRIENNSK